MRKFATGIVARLAAIELFSMRDMFWQYTASFGVAIFGALFLLGAGRAMGPEQFGIYAIATAVPTVVNAFFDYRIQEVSIVILRENIGSVAAARNARVLFALDVIARTIACAVSIPMGYLIARYMGLEMDPVVPVLAALTVFLAKAGNGLAIGVMRLAGSIQSYAVLQSLDWALRLAGLMVLIVSDRLSVANALWIQLPAALGINAWIVRLAVRICGELFGRLTFPGSIFKELLGVWQDRRRLLLGSQAISSVDSVVKEFDTLICGFLLSASDVAIYKIAKSIAAIAWKCVDPLFVVILPNIAAFVADERMDALSTILKKSSAWLFVLGIVVTVAVSIGAYPFIPMVMGDAYLPVRGILPLISLWIVVSLPFIWTHSVAMATHNSALQAVAGLLGAVVGALALAAGAWAWGVHGAALGLSVAFAAPFLISWAFLVRRKIIRW